MSKWFLSVKHLNKWSKYTHCHNTTNTSTQVGRDKVISLTTHTTPPHHTENGRQPQFFQ